MNHAESSIHPHLFAPASTSICRHRSNLWRNFGSACPCKPTDIVSAPCSGKTRVNYDDLREDEVRELYALAKSFMQVRAHMQMFVCVGLFACVWGQRGCRVCGCTTVLRGIAEERKVRGIRVSPLSSRLL